MSLLVSIVKAINVTWAGAFGFLPQELPGTALFTEWNWWVWRFHQLEIGNIDYNRAFNP